MTRPQLHTATQQKGINSIEQRIAPLKPRKPFKKQTAKDALVLPSPSLKAEWVKYGTFNIIYQSQTGSACADQI